MEEESVVELELDYDEDEDIQDTQDRNGELNSDGEEGGGEDQEELRNNLKNLDFKDDVQTEDAGDKKRSALAGVSFSTAARGVNRQENRVKFKTDEDGSENESGSVSGSNRRPSNHTASLPPPVQDPSFIGRRDSNFFDKVVPFTKGRRKKVSL